MKNRAILHILFIAVLGFLIYSNVYNNEFTFDDIPIIVENPAVRDIKNIPLLWEKFNTRFLTGISFALNYATGGLRVAGYHIVNILIHVINAFLVYVFVRTLLRAPYFRNIPISIQGGRVAFFSALIFLSHPLQTQAVTYITQRATSLAVLFYLVTLICYLKARLNQKPLLMGLAFAAALAGSFSKEMTATIPLMLLTIEFFFFGKGKPGIAGLAFFTIPVIIFSALLLGRHDHSLLSLGRQLTTTPFDPKYLFTQITVLSTYLRLLVFPANQNLDYDYPLAAGFFEPRVLFSLFVLTALVGIAVSQFKKNRLISFCVAWFFLTTSVEFMACSIVQRDMIFEHYLYLPMIGFSIFISSALFLWLEKPKRVTVLMAVLILIFSILTYQRNSIWRNNMTLWQDVLAKSPHKARPYNNLGIAYAKKGDYDTAAIYYQKALELDPSMALVYVNLGVDYGKKGDYDKEIEYNQKALILDPTLVQAYSNVGLAYAQKGLYDEAFTYTQKAIELDPLYAPALSNLGLIYGQINHYEAALGLFEKAVNLNPNIAEIYGNLGLIHLKMGHVDKAIEAYQKAIVLNPSDVQVHNNLAILYDELQNPTKAIEYNQKAIAVNPQNAIAYNNLGLIYAKLGKVDEAIAHYQKSITIDPKNVEAYSNLSLMYAQKSDFNNAVESGQEAIALNPSYAPAYNNLGSIYGQMGDHDKAIGLFQKSQELLPDDIRVQSNLGFAYMQKGQYEKSIEHYKKALALNPRDVALEAMLGFVYFKNGHTDQARQQINKLRELGREDLSHQLETLINKK